MFKHFKTCPYFTQKFGSDESENCQKKVFYDMRVIIIPLFVCLFCRLIC